MQPAGINRASMPCGTGQPPGDSSHLIASCPEPLSHCSPRCQQCQPPGRPGVAQGHRCDSSCPHQVGTRLLPSALLHLFPVHRSLAAGVRVHPTSSPHQRDSPTGNDGGSNNPRQLLMQMLIRHRGTIITKVGSLFGKSWSFEV